MPPLSFWDCMIGIIEEHSDEIYGESCYLLR